MRIAGKNKGERFAECYRLGREASKALPTFSTEDQIMKEFGFKNRQEAHWQCLVALGKLILRCRKSIREDVR